MRSSRVEVETMPLRTSSECFGFEIGVSPVTHILAEAMYDFMTTE